MSPDHSGDKSLPREDSSSTSPKTSQLTGPLSPLLCLMLGGCGGGRCQGGLDEPSKSFPGHDSIQRKAREGGGRGEQHLKMLRSQED